MGVFENIRRIIDGLSYGMPRIRSMTSRKRLLLRALLSVILALLFVIPSDSEGSPHEAPSRTK